MQLAYDELAVECEERGIEKCGIQTNDETRRFKAFASIFAQYESVRGDMREWSLLPKPG
jgi:hypothetical protein